MTISLIGSAVHAALLLPQLLSYVASKFPGSILVYVRVGWLGRWFVMLVLSSIIGLAIVSCGGFV